MDSIDDIRNAIENFRRAGRLPELREALRAMDVDRSGDISFSEMRDQQYLARYCIAVSGTARQGYHCSDGEMPDRGTGYGFRLDMNVAARDAANDYLEFRREYGRIPGARSAAAASAQNDIASLNEVLAEANLPRLSLEFFDQVAAHVDQNYERYNRQGYVPVAQPPSSMRVINF